MKTKDFRIKVISVVLSAALMASGTPIYAHEAGTDVTEETALEESTHEGTVENKESMEEQKNITDKVCDTEKNMENSNTDSADNMKQENHGTDDESSITADEIKTELSEETDSEDTGLSTNDDTDAGSHTDGDTDADVSADENTQTEEDTHEHILSYQSGNDGTHLVTCDDGTCEYHETEDCNYDESGICQDCGYQKPEKEVHEHDFVYESNHDGTHMKSCKDENCGYEPVWKDCEFNENEICKDCGYEKPVEKFKVTFLGKEDKEITVKEFEKDYSLTEDDLPEAPELEGFVFSGWQNVPDKVTKDCTITASYTDKMLKVTFTGKDDTVLKEIEVKYGTKLTRDDLPEVKGDDFVFLGWYNSNGKRFIWLTTEVKEDIVLKAKTKTIYSTTLTGECDGIKVTLRGNLPENAELVIKNEKNEDYLNLYSDMKPSDTDEILLQYFSLEPFVTAALDISIEVDGEEYQPKDFGETVEVTLSGLEKKDSEQEVKHIYENGNIEVVGEVKEEKNNVTFETDSFSVYTVGGVDYDTSNATNTWDAGDNIKAYLFSDGMFMLIGSGDMWDYRTTKAWDNQKDNIKKIYISNGITSIGYKTFYQCSKITGNLIIPDSITYISESAFSGCSGFTGNLVIPDSVTAIDKYAFYYCSGFDSITIGNDVASIGYSAFALSYNPTKTKTKLYSTNEVALSYQWANCNRQVSWSELVSIDAEYNGSSIEGILPQKSDFIIKSKICSYSPNDYSPTDTNTSINILSDSNYTLTGNPIVAGQNNEYTVSYTLDRVTKTDTVNITGIAKSETSRVLNSITVSYSGSDIIEGLQPNKDNITVTGHYTVSYDNGTAEQKDVIISNNDVVFTIGNATIGTNTVTVKYNGKSDSFTYTGIEKSETSRVLTKIEASYTGSNIYVGQAPTAYMVRATYHIVYDNNDETDDTITINNSRVTLSGDNTAREGINTVTVSFTDNGLTKTDSFSYIGIRATVTDKLLQSISAVYNGTIYEDDDVNADDITVTGTYQVTYSDGIIKTEDETINTDNCMITGDITANDGRNIIFIEYNGKKASVEYTAITKIETARELISITVSYQGSNIIEGLAINKSDIRATATYEITYNSGEHETISEQIDSYDLTVPAHVTMVGNNTVTVSYEYDSITKSAILNYSGIQKTETGRKLTDIRVSYTGGDVTEGLSVDKNSILVYADYEISYDNGTKETLQELVPADKIKVTEHETVLGNNTVTVSYTHNTITKEKKITYTGIRAVETGRTLTGIEVGYHGTDITEYLEINNDDISILAKYTVLYNNGKSADIKSQISVADAVITKSKTTIGDNEVMVSYTEGTVTVTNTFIYTGIPAVITDKKLTDISVTYTGGNVTEGNTVDKTKIKVIGTYEATYNNGKTGTVTEDINIEDVIISEKKAIVGENTIEISYTYKNVTMTDSFTYTGIKRQITSAGGSDSKDDTHDDIQTVTAPVAPVIWPVVAEPVNSIVIPPVFLPEIPVEEIKPPVQITNPFEIIIEGIKEEITESGNHEQVSEIVEEIIMEQSMEIMTEEDQTESENIETEINDVSDNEPFSLKNLWWIILLIILIAIGLKVYSIKKDNETEL